MRSIIGQPQHESRLFNPQRFHRRQKEGKHPNRLGCFKAVDAFNIAEELRRDGFKVRLFGRGSKQLRRTASNSDDSRRYYNNFAAKKAPFVAVYVYGDEV